MLVLKRCAMVVDRRPANAMNFVVVETSVDQGRSAVAAAAYDSVFNRGLREGVGTGQLTPEPRVVLGVRPEHITHHDPTWTARATVGQIGGMVEVVEPTDAGTIAVVRIGQRDVVARCEPDAARKENKTVRLVIDMNKACLFDPDSERSI